MTQDPSGARSSLLSAAAQDMVLHQRNQMLWQQQQQHANSSLDATSGIGARPARNSAFTRRPQATLAGADRAQLGSENVQRQQQLFNVHT